MVCALEQQKSSDSNYVGSFYWEVKIREHNDTDIHHCSCTFCVLIFGSHKHIEICRFNWSTSAPKYCRCIGQWNLWKPASLKMTWMYLRQSRIWVLVNKSKLQVIYIYIIKKKSSQKFFQTEHNYIQKRMNMRSSAGDTTLIWYSTF